MLLRRLLSLIFPDWITTLLTLYHDLSSAWAQRAPRERGMYEILTYDSTLELVDTKGQTAHVKRHQKVKFLQDNIIAFQDHAWGDGDIFADYAVSPGIEVDRYQDGDRFNVLISLRDQKPRGHRGLLL